SVDKTSLLLHRTIDENTDSIEIVPCCTKPDSCGDLVVKFIGSDVKTIVGVEPGQVTLTLTGLTVGGVAFSPSDTIRVKD
ncbi:hypothetical protein ACFL5F_04650, partial [Planctomycetota bacterium]